MRWKLKRFIKDKATRNWTSIFGALIIAPALYVTLVLAFVSYLFYEPQKDFDREKWFTDKHSRFEMRDDIVESEILKDKSKSEIIDFIGNPDDGDSTDIWTYDLGMSASLGFRFNILEVTFRNDIVYEVKNIEIVD